MEYKKALLLLEKMVDEGSVPEVLENLAAICRLKEEHLRTKWQDETTARLWLRMAHRIESLAVQLSKLR